MMEGKLTTMVVNRSEVDKTVKVGNRNCFAPLAVVKKVCGYTMKLCVNWTYQEVSLEEKNGAAGKKLIFNSDDCCDYERRTVKESEGNFFADRGRRKQYFNAEERTLTNSSIHLAYRAAHGTYDGVRCNDILAGDSKLACSALTLARHARTGGLRRGSDELVGLVLELMKFAESACGSPLICPACTHMSDGNFQDPRKYAESLVMLARDVDAHPWGAFGFMHPSKYLPFLQQLAGDLIDH